MKAKHVFWGLFFVTIGILLLVYNFSPFEIHLGNVWKYWPIVLILWGIAILIKQEFIKLLIAAAASILLAVTLFSSFQSLFSLTNNNFQIVIDGDKDYDTTRYVEPYDSLLNSAKLILKSGAGSFNITGTSDSLFDALVYSTDSKYNMTSIMQNDEAVIKMELESKKFKLGKNVNKVYMKLNPEPVWNFDFDIGAAACNFDLTDFKVERLNIDMGAASLDLKLGSLYYETIVVVDAGASSIDIDVPDNAGCEIQTDISLSSKDFHGFREITDDIYRTPGFEDADKKIYIKINTGVSSVDVRRY
ncbi:MAG: hypothetical protein Kow0098_08470 [Ignavibacteriaceae bacterium]